MFGLAIATAVIAAPPKQAAPSPRPAPALSTIKKVKVLEGIRIVAAAGAATGNMMAISLENGTVRIVDAATAQTRFTLTGHPQACYGLAFNKTGTVLATGDDTGRIWLWNPKNGKKIREFKRDKGHKRGIQSINFSWDGRKLLTVGKDDVIHIWNATGSLDPTATIYGKGANFYGAQFLKNGNIVTGTLKEGARLYRSGTYSLASTMTLPGGQGANDLAVNSAGTQAYTAGRDGKVVFWNIGSHARIGGVQAHSDWVIYSALAPGGRTLATSSNDRTIKFWDVKAGKLMAQVEDMSSVGSPLAFAGSGKYFIGADASDQATIFQVNPAQ